MMRHRISALAVLVSACCGLFVTHAESADLTGVWATDSAVCNKVFRKTGNKVAFTKNSELYGNGFIIEDKKIRGLTAACRIKTMKEEGAVVHMIAACATDIMLSDVQFSVKIVDANAITRVFPSMPEIENRYYRCSL